RPGSGGHWLLILAMMVVAALLVGLPFARGSASLVDYSFFRSQLETGEEGNVESLVWSENRLSGEWKDPPEDPKQPGKKLAKKFTTILPTYEDKELIPLLQQRHIAWTSEPSTWGPGANLLLTGMSTLLVVAFVWFMLRRSVDPLGPGGMAGSFIR